MNPVRDNQNANNINRPNYGRPGRPISNGMNNTAVFSLARYPFVGGAEIALKEITERLPEFSFQIFSHDFQKYGHGKLVKFLYIFHAWRAAEKAHKKEPFSAMWAVMASYGGLAALLFKIFHPSVPFLLTIQEGDSEAHILRRVGIFYTFWKMIFKKADHIQVISNYLADFARRHGATCPIDVVPNGVNVDAYKSDKTDKSNKAYTIITTSRLVFKNGVDILIRAMAVIASEAKQSYKNDGKIATAKVPRDDIRLLILGSGPDEKKLKNLAAELGVADTIEFFGHVEPGLIPGYLSKADLFVRASRSEGLGNSFLEAMAAGLPVIGTKVGGIPDFLVPLSLRGSDSDRGNLANGFFVEVNSPRDLAEKIMILLENDQLRKKLGESGRKLVLANYSWDSISGKMEKIFKNLEIRNSKLKITRLLIATGIYPPDIGGPATYTVLMEKELPKRGIEVFVLPFTKYRQLPKWKRHWQYYRDCRKMVIEKNIDAIYAQDPVSVGLPASQVAKKLGKKFFIRVAGDYAWEQAAQRFGVKDTIDDFQNKKYGWKAELLRKIQKFVVGRADLVITPSKYFQQLVGGWNNPEKVHCIYNGITLSDNVRSPRSARDDGKTILSAGRLVSWKGFNTLIELMGELPDWKLVIVGDGPERKNLESRIKNLGLENRAILAGAIEREDLLSYLHRANLFVLNTSFESFSFQVVEAMHAGVPVITTNIGNLAEIIDNNKEGVLVEPNNKEQILAAIKKISEDDSFRDMIVRNAKEKAKKFSISRTVDNLVHLINEGHA